MKKPTAAQRKVLEAIIAGDHLLFFCNRPIAKIKCVEAGWIRSDDLGNYTLTPLGRSMIEKDRER